MEVKYKEAFEQISIELSPLQINHLIKYKELLQIWNKKMNLTAVDDDYGILWRHFIDSCQILEYIKINENDRIIDVGTGAGFPGLPVAIVSQCQTTLADSLNKRISFLNEVIQENKLMNIQTIHSRAEDLGHQQEHRERYDYVLARGVTKLPVLLEYTLPFLKIGGKFIAYKSADVEDEVMSAKRATSLLNAELIDIIKFKDHDGQLRSFVIYQKHDKTPEKYPRKAGKPLKKPL